MHFKRRYWRPRTFEPNFDIVVFAMSLGGIDAFRRVVNALPSDFPVPIAAVQHLSPNFRSTLVEVLQHRARLRIAWAQQGGRLERGSVVLAPPDHHLLIADRGACILSRGPKLSLARPSADALFESAAGRCRTLGVVLTGRGSDGAAGARIIKERGGVVVAQDIASSLEPSMPQSVIERGDADFVLPLHRIADAVVSLVSVPGIASLFGARRAA
jgi:two-component system chemotaxis response regulator CheB